MSDTLLDELLAKPVGPSLPTRQLDPEKDFTRQIEVAGDAAEVTVRGPAEMDHESSATDVLRAHGLAPSDWDVKGFRSSEWTMPGGELGVSTRFTFVRHQPTTEAERPDLDELFSLIDNYDPPRLATAERQGDHTLIIALGDMQIGKADGDGVAGTLRRTITCIDKATALLAEYRKRFSIGHVHLAWLGDHIEGYQSQGGANAWRTALTLTEQIRVTRRIMAHAVLGLAPLVERLTVAAVPGNHGEAVRFNGKGVTRYDDSHDTDALIAVQEAVSLAPEEFRHVEFFVPDTDELTLVVDCSGTVVAHAHGHQWKGGKHFDWWKGQSFSKASAMHQADVLLAGHLHHEFVDTDGPRTFIQIPAMESESTWWRHRTGTVGAPGLMVMVTKNGQVPVKEVVR
ncbi:MULTISPECIES: hypothetical protein [Streptomyces]|uniref:hypothetical protein n=1 Tax=Streptomyces TaxID=1883 RepID=UPI00227202FD|nr:MULTISPECIES: hypothetical protein [unclassified Streptomyces]MCY0923286.1 hypothetical protein [Streptomyces sp. H27-G5]MCY0943971.1 hypothetical protein [Streptomyces sp. H34-AA3]MCY0956309.1 hypothetical protein [Streptomyces sp. H27-H5]MCZ4082329.1 hypothetical protein [Streptomyces sp. H34-S5]